MGRLAPAHGFRARAAIRLTVEQSARKFANDHQLPVRIFGVTGGYEARSADRGTPKGAHILLDTIAPIPASGNGHGASVQVQMPEPIPAPPPTPPPAPPAGPSDPEPPLPRPPLTAMPGLDAEDRGALADQLVTRGRVTPGKPAMRRPPSTEKAD